MKPYGAFLNGKLVKAWKSLPIGYDLEGVEYDDLRELSEQEVNEITQ